MSRPLVCLLALLALVIGLAPVTAYADEEIYYASDEEAEEALKVFKKEYKAKGLKGDDKLMQRDWAMSELAKIQHEDVVKELGKLTKAGDSDLRTLAVIYLGEMNGFPDMAGKLIVEAIRKNKKDPVLVMSGLQSLPRIGYLGAGEQLRDFLKDRDYAIRKNAIRTIGDLNDVRLMDDLLKILGIDSTKNEKQQQGEKEGEKKKSGEKEVVQEGYSWEGAEAKVDYGDADNNKRENPEAKKKAEAQIAQNKAAAKAAAGKGGGAGGPSMGGSGAGPRGGTSRTVEELVPTILKALYRMTGEKFESGAEINEWLREHKEDIEERCKLLDEMEKEQRKGK